MQISLLNERITFQRNVILTDRIGNHMSSWNDEFSCYATVGGESGKETAVVGTTVRIRILPLLSVGAPLRRLSAPQAIA